MFLSIVILAASIVAVHSENNAYGKAQAAPAYGQPAPAYGQPAPAYGQPARAYGRPAPVYNQYGHYNRVVFKPAAPLIDPKYYQNVLNGFQQCVNQKCKKSSYVASSEGLQVLGEYAACVTACTAKQMMNSISDFKNLLSKMYDIGSAQLAQTRKYLASTEDYKVLENNTRICDSCCLPNDYFIKFDEIMIPVKSAFENSYSAYGKSQWSNKRLISAKAYLDHCTSSDKKELFLGKLRIECNVNLMVYLEQMQRNIGHLILAPKCKDLAPDNACSYEKDKNPRASDFEEDMCVAYECSTNGKRENVVLPLIKEVNEAKNYKDSCPSDIYKDHEIKYRRVPRHLLKLYLINDGLPSAFNSKLVEQLDAYDYSKDVNLDPCKYDFKLSQLGDYSGFDQVIPQAAELEAIKNCPLNGKFEYCNMRQYANWLQEQLFDDSKCPIIDMGYDALSDDESASMTLACIYKVVTLKCDCMEAVLNCYEHEHKFNSAFGKTVGKAASILCGFILCQRPRVYSLFGGQQAINKARIMQKVLMEVGAIESIDTSSMPPATIAFISLGVGMIAFMIVKTVIGKLNAREHLKVENGYQNLI